MGVRPGVPSIRVPPAKPANRRCAWKAVSLNANWGIVGARTMALRPAKSSMAANPGEYRKPVPVISNVPARGNAWMPASAEAVCDPVISNRENVGFVASNSVSARVVNGAPGATVSSSEAANLANSVCVAAAAFSRATTIASGTPARERAFVSPWTRNHAVNAACASATISADGPIAVIPITTGGVVTNVVGSFACPTVGVIPMNVHHVLTMPAGNSGSVSKTACARLVFNERIKRSHATHRFLHSRI